MFNKARRKACLRGEKSVSAEKVIKAFSQFLPDIKISIEETGSSMSQKPLKSKELNLIFTCDSPDKFSKLLKILDKSFSYALSVDHDLKSCPTVLTPEHLRRIVSDQPWTWDSPLPIKSSTGDNSAKVVIEGVLPKYTLGSTGKSERYFVKIFPSVISRHLKPVKVHDADLQTENERLLSISISSD